MINLSIKNNIDFIQTSLQKYFQNQTKPVQKTLPLVILSSALSGSFCITEIATKMQDITKISYSGNENKLLRFLTSTTFQTNEKTWRNYFNFLFDSLREKGLKNSENLQINVDMTSEKNNLLILSASIIYQNVNYPLYFSMVKYPKREDNFSQKNFEKAFINMLKQLLSKKYEYTIVADRGFGNLRFINICEENGFNFCIRLNENLNLILNEKKQNLQEFKGQNEEFEALVKKWQKYLNFTISTKNEKTWFICHNKNINAQKSYENRWKIENMFKNLKSAGFDFEKRKIKKFHSVKKLLFITIFAYSIYLFVGDFINKNDKLKKKFKNHLELFSQFSI